MDFLTQVLLGCVIGELLLGRKYGKKGLILGAFVGALPDSDIILNIFFNDLNDIIYHRVFTHSFTFAILGGLIFAYLTTKVSYFKKIKFNELYLVYFFGILTHFLIDLLTTYGTAIFYPFSTKTYSLNSIFIIDLFYTIPLLVFLIIGIKKKDKEKRFKIVLIGFIISSLYLISGIMVQNIVQDQIEKDFIAQGMKIDSLIVQPTPSNIITWRVVAQNENYIYEGFKSVHKLDEKTKFDKYKKDLELRDEIKSIPRINELIEFSQNFYMLMKDEEKLIYVDIRFGTIKSTRIFQFELTKEEIIMNRH